MTDLTGRLVLVTGAGGRLGRVLVAQLAAAGATVAALDRHPSDDLPERAFAVEADATDEGSVARAFSAVEERAGVPWSVIHTVGMWDGGPLAETGLDAWQRVLDVNLTSAFVTVREAVRRMDAGRVVAIASRQGADRAPAQQAAYAASKAGVVRLVEAASAEHDAIAAVAVAPSMILFGGEEPGTGGVSAEAVADLCVYLCGDGGRVHDGATLRAYGDG